MAEIKSALELAMERANAIKVDTKELKRKELEKKGKTAASSFLNKPKFSMEEWFNGLNSSEKETQLKGVLWVFKANIKLPTNTSDVDRLLKIKEGISIISQKTEVIDQVFGQLTNIFQQYIENSKQLLAQCKEQFAPKLQQKAMELAQQTGQLIPIEPETDRDFIEFHKQNQDQVDNHFKEYINQALEIMDTLI